MIWGIYCLQFCKKSADHKEGNTCSEVPIDRSAISPSRFFPYVAIKCFKQKILAQCFILLTNVSIKSCLTSLIPLTW